MRDLRRRSEGRFLRLWFSDTCFSLVSPEKCSQTKKLKDLLACLLGSAGARGHSIFFVRHLISLIYILFMIDWKMQNMKLVMSKFYTLDCIFCVLLFFRKDFSPILIKKYWPLLKLSPRLWRLSQKLVNSRGHALDKYLFLFLII